MIAVTGTSHMTSCALTSNAGDTAKTRAAINRNRPAESRDALRDGWLYTGDIGEIDSAGCLAIRDHKKDMAIVGGYNVYPREIEDVLLRHPDVADAAVVGMPDAYRGEVLVGHVVMRPGAAADAGALLAHCRANLAKFKLPARLRFAESLPKTPANKTDKNALRRMAEAARAAV
jgi:long-chain acyl-CoA synthetase